MWKFILQEWKYWLRAPMTWIFLLINTLLILGAVGSDNVVIGGATGSVHKNAPYVIQNYYGIMSLLCLLMTTAYMNATANRDFAHGMYQFIFSSPVKKSHYFFGKFIGAVSIAVLPMLGISLGSILGAMIPNLDPERYGAFLWSGHLNGVLAFGIPNTIITGVLLYGLAIVFRSNIISFVGAMLILVFYIVSRGYTQDLEKEWLANILDPFGFKPFEIMSKYMTVDEKNMLSVPLSGPFLLNRIIWLFTSLGLLFLFYFNFSFSEKKARFAKKQKASEIETSNTLTQAPVINAAKNSFSIGTWLRMVVFELRSVISHPTFIILLLLGMINLTASLTSFTQGFGLKQYPVTYQVIETIRGSFFIFLISFITFYTGVLVWRERDCRVNEIQDATPVQTFMLISSKFFAMIGSIAMILLMTILVGSLAQMFYGYFRFEYRVYFTSLLVLDLLAFSYLVVASLLIHFLINNRYVGYFAFITFVILNEFIWNVWQINSNMIPFGAIPNVTFSDMNGFGPFVKAAGWFHLYWVLFCAILFYVITGFYIRGKENRFASRLKSATAFFKQHKWGLSFFVIAFLICAAVVYYNTLVINRFENASEMEQIQVDYERTYKKYQTLAQPRFYKFVYGIDIYPERRSVVARIKSMAINQADQPIREIHFTLPEIYDTIQISIPGAKLKVDDKKLKYRIYSLAQVLNPGDSLAIDFRFSKNSRGFENEVSFLKITHNGSFFDNTDIIPQIGYLSNNELQDKNKRKKYKLPPKKRMEKLDENNLKARANNYISSCSDWVDVSSVVSTSEGQIAIAPGSLIREWREGNRRFFEYKLDQKSLNFYSFMSGNYEVARKKWKGINLEVYYIREHSYNVPNMLRSMEKSLEYYTTQFGKYHHKQCRIIEFPRYASFAQAFPGTMPYSEGIGFIADLRDVKIEDIDLVYYVVAHEMGHQYWAHQLCGADMQGSEWMSEGFAQYSALMVMEKEYGKNRMKRFLKYEMDEYLTNRGIESEAEQPMYKTQSQAYIHYQKASVVMYYLKEMIGEDRLNQALRSLIDSFAYHHPPYATSLDALRAIRAVTPDSLQYVVSDLFEKITLFSNRVVEAKSRKTGNSYEVTLVCSSQKFLADSLGNETEIKINDYIDVACFGSPEGEDKIGKRIFYQRRKINQKDNTIVFTTAEQPFQVGLDPFNYLIDRVPDDNLKWIDQE